MSEFKVTGMKSREVIDSRGNPTVEVDLKVNESWGRSMVPSGASTGAYEAHELRDGDKKRFLGKGVLKAVENVEKEIFSALEGKAWSQSSLDQFLIELDGTETKSRLGANAILGVSLAFAKAQALAQGRPLYQTLGGQEKTLPVPLMNVINGGAHANNNLDVQEFMIVPHGFSTFRDSLRAGCEIFQTLKTNLKKKNHPIAVGDEGGFAPNLGSNQEALELLSLAVEDSGYRLGEDVSFALDVASTEFFVEGKYNWQGELISGEELMNIYLEWSKSFPIKSIEDAFAEDDWKHWIMMTSQAGNSMQLVGDDLFVTNPKRFKKGIDEKAATAILLKVNQIGTLTETMQAISMAKEARFKNVISHRSGETEDTIISDLAVGLQCEQIKTGSLCRSERTAKYNQLLRIEEQLAGEGKFWADRAFD